jgi:hypothetical protein
MSFASIRPRFAPPAGVALLSLTLAVAISLLALTPALALARTFDPTLVISDDNMRAYDSMSAAQIQKFLNSKPGPLKRMSFQRHDNGSTASAAVIIWEACQAWHISPKVMLTMLQKEQSLLTRKHLAGHTLQRAIGAGCPDSGGCKYPGFGNQMWNGARMLDGYGEKGKTTPYVPVWKPGLINKFTGKVTATRNLATYKLYVYNPSIGAKAPYGDLSKQSLSGNANFWKIYWKYFGNPFAAVRAQSIASGQAAATITLKQQSASRLYSQATTLTGQLASANPTAAPVAGAIVSLQQPVGSSWVAIAGTAQAVSATGTFAFRLSPRSTSRVRVVFAGTSALGRAVSGCFVTEAIPTLAVSVPTTITSSKTVATISGTLSPGHAGKVKVGLYRASKGTYRLWKTLSVTSGRSGAWKLRVKLARGAWRLRATHIDSGHAMGGSAWCYTTVAK